ncbi:MAG: ornithine cyclodeaminase family protein [Rhizobiaceae bacterium]|nr:ornithine cyclodeaminase family protein [Rhizobiaceae bacterium]
MRIISATEVNETLDFPALINVLRDAFRLGAVQPVRHHHTVERPQGEPTTLLLMPAWTDFATGDLDSNGHIGVKIASVSPDNNKIGKPAVMAQYLLLDGTTGEPQALIDGASLTLWRTAAASALAADYLARPDASRLLVVGAGALAPYLARAHAALRPIREIAIWNRTPENAERVVAGLAAGGFQAGVVEDIEPAIAEADIITAATISTVPLIHGAALRPGTHVDLVGAFSPTMRESDDEAIRRARVYVDTRGGALKEAGDIVQAISSGALTEDAIAGDLFQLARGDAAGRRGADEITLFKSVGAALEDLAAAIYVSGKLAAD